MKPQFNTTRPLSWSAISSFDYDPEQWYESYVLFKRSTSKELVFGSKVDRAIQNEPDFMPDLPRYPLMQHKMNAWLGDIELVGLPDGLCFDDMLLADYKTGKVAWDQKRADLTGQLTMYLLLIWLTEKLPPDPFRCFIHWLPTCENGDFSISLVKPWRVETFETRRSMQDVLKFGAYIKKARKAMIAYAENHA